jgi:hypothetical protein
MKSTDPDQTGAGDDGFGFFIRDSNEAPEDRIGKIIFMGIMLTFLAGLALLILWALAEWWVL